MFFVASLRKIQFPPLIRQGIANQRLKSTHQSPPGSTSSSSSSSSPSSSIPKPSCSSGGYGGNGDGNNGRETLFSRPISSFVAGLGILYSFNFNSPSVFDNSSFCFADSSEETDPEAVDADAWEDFPAKKPNFLFGDAYRKRVFFKYEKRIRLQSPPEKVFEYFASFQTPSGEILMTPADLMRAVVTVFPPSESENVRGGFLRGEKNSPDDLRCPPSHFFMLFDTDNDELISFPEYIFFVTLLRIPEISFSAAFKMFDIDSNGEIDRDEFKRVMALMRSQSPQTSRHRDGRRSAAGSLTTDTVEDGGLVEYFFGKDGQNKLSHDRFVQFLNDLHDEILRLEFAHYDHNQCGTISAADFALSVVAAADMAEIDRLLDRVDRINDEESLKSIKINFQEFKNFSELRSKLRPLSLALFSYGQATGGLTKSDFKRASSQVCGVSLTDSVIDIIFHVFDADLDGRLTLEEFVRVLERRQGETELQPSQTGTGGKGLISCWFNCAANRSGSKLSV